MNKQPEGDSQSPNVPASGLSVMRHVGMCCHATKAHVFGRLGKGTN